jgi:hypothetical protein
VLDKHIIYRNKAFGSRLSYKIKRSTVSGQWWSIVVKNHDAKGWDLPIHKQQKLISAQCTARQAVWETTGLNVEVGKLLFTAPDETQYFECKLTDVFSRQLQGYPVPAWTQRKTSEISLVDSLSSEQDH